MEFLKIDVATHAGVGIATASVVNGGFKGIKSKMI